jgi:cytochrome c
MIKKLSFLFFIGFLFFSACNKEPGEALFKDREFASNKKSVSCSFCHSGAAKLNDTDTQTIFNIDGKTYNSIESVINQVMITQFMQGQPIDEKSQQMKDLVAYVKKLSKEKK